MQALDGLRVIDMATVIAAPGAARYLADCPYEAGMVVSSEAFLTIPGVGAATHEDIFIITDHGAELITTSPRVFW